MKKILNMKILIIQEKGRHEKNWQFRESLNFQRAFQKIGVESVVWGLNYPNFNITFEEVSKDCDILLCIENYNNGWLPNMINFKGLKLFWSIDSHCVPQQHVTTCDSNKFDIVLNAIESHSKYFYNQKCYYLPNAYPDDLIYYKPEISKTVDVGFCGNWVNRQDWILSIPNIKKDIMVIGDDMVNNINSFKIHFNRNMADDINYRTFETLGCKTFLLTNYTENLDKLFNIGEHLVTYNTKEDLNDKIRYYLNNPDLLNKISNAGYEHVRKNHTYLNRAYEILQIIKEYK
jgi:spore maturation protein CgeB